MKKTYFVVATISLLALTACLVKQPNQTGLGDPTTADAINAAFEQAQAGLDPVKGFQVGDQGTVLTSDSVMGNTSVTETDYYQIIAVTTTSYTLQATVAGATTQDTYYRPGMEPTPAPTATPSPTPVAKNSLPPKSLGRVAHFFASILDYAHQLFARITIEPSTAVGENNFPANLLPGRAIAATPGTRWNLETEKKIRGQNKTISPKILDATAAPTATPAPTVTSDNYYGLMVFADTFTSSNGTSPVTVPTTHINFNEVVGTSDGQSQRLQWSYQFSVKVPGIFILMDRCWSEVLTQAGVQTPLTHCDNQVSVFQAGAGSH